MPLIRYARLTFLFASVWLFSQCTALRPVGSTGSGPSHASVSAFRQEVVQFARQQLGTTYRYGGRDPRQGFDCSGFTHYVLQRFDVNVTPQSGAQAREGRGLSLQAARPGDLIYFKRSAVGPVFHVAMVVSNDSRGLVVVHSTTSSGVITTNLSESSYWGPKAVGARDVIGR